MEIKRTEIDGLLIIKPPVFPDDRGYFFESWNDKRYPEFGIDAHFVQDNISKSTKGTIRGLHYQVGDFAQGKLCQALYGAVIDIAVDIRSGSPTYGKYAAIELSDKNNHQLWIPPGFAHGFEVISDECIFHYKCTAFYSKKDERAIIYNDPDIGIKWKTEAPLLSEKDRQAIPFREIGKDFIWKK